MGKKHVIINLLCLSTYQDRTVCCGRGHVCILLKHEHYSYLSIRPAWMHALLCCTCSLFPKAKFIMAPGTKRRGWGGGQSSIGPLSLSRLDPPVITISHYTMMKRPTTGYWSVFSVGTGGVQKGCAAREVVGGWGVGCDSQLETDVIASSKHRAPGNTTPHKQRHAQICCVAAVAA